MTGALAPWFGLLACAAVILLAGPVLSRTGDVIAHRTGVSRGWIGLVLLATVTSLPELVTGLAAVTVADEPDIAVGDLLGSCVFNLAILFVLDFLVRGESLYRRAARGHVLSAAFGIVLLGVPGIALIARDHAAGVALGHVGVYVVPMILVYFVAIRALHVHQREERTGAVEEVAEHLRGVTLREAVARYALAGLLVVAAGSFLPFVAAELAARMGWDTTFVGTLFVAAVTSLPEVVVTVAAVRLGALDMAIAGLLGSNLFNMLILVVDDLAYVEGPLLDAAAPGHAVSVVSAMVMSGLVIVGVTFRPRERLMRRLGWIGLALFAIYLLNAFLLYLHG
jgi:cation:H+ antiporter